MFLAKEMCLLKSDRLMSGLPIAKIIAGRVIRLGIVPCRMVISSLFMIFIAWVLELSRLMLCTLELAVWFEKK